MRIAFCIYLINVVSGTLYFGATRLSHECQHEVNFLAAKYDRLFSKAVPQIAQDSFWPVKPMRLGQVTGLDTNLQDELVAFHRGDHVWDLGSFDSDGNYELKSDGPIKQDPIVTFDPETGRVLSSRGRNQFYLPHGLTVDHEGNLWLTDVALHQVFKLPSDSDEPTLVLGTAFQPGSDRRHFCKPTDVAVSSSGEFFVSDGYCNSRIIKYAANGTFMTEWGFTAPTRNGGGSQDYLIPHSLALSEKQNMICVADREHERILCYTAGLDGKKAGQLVVCPIQGSAIGPVYAIRIKDDMLFAVTGPSLTKRAKGFTIHLQSRSLDRLREPLRPWVIVGEWEPRSGFGRPHCLALCPNTGSLFVGEIGPNRIVKFVSE